jgi:hypothetical protein
MQNVRARKTSAQQITIRAERELRKQAVAQGIPDFMLRLAAAQQICFVPTKTMPRHRHD